MNGWADLHEHSLPGWDGQDELDGNDKLDFRLWKALIVVRSRLAGQVRYDGRTFSGSLAQRQSNGFVVLSWALAIFRPHLRAMQAHAAIQCDNPKEQYENDCELDAQGGPDAELRGI